MRGQAVGALALAAALGLGAAGCGEDSPKPGPVTGSDSRTPTGSARTATAKWIEALNSGSAALDPDRLRALSAPDCKPCQIIVDYLTEIASQGGYIRGGEWEDAQLIVRSSSPSKAVVDARVTVSPQQVKEGAQARVKEFAGGQDVPKRFTLEATSSGWLVSDLQQEDSL